MVTRLLPTQTYDPARGSFFVNDAPVRGKKFEGEQVYRGSFHLEKTPHGVIMHPHPQAIDFIVR